MSVLESLYVFLTNLPAFLVKLQLILFAWFYYQLIKISKKYHLGWTEAVARRCSIKKVFLEIS